MQVTATLNRLHKIVERLKARNTELRQDVLQYSHPVNVTLAKGMFSIPVDQAGRSEKIIALLGDIYEVSKTICDIKNGISSKNEALGINALLTEKHEQQFAKSVALGVKASFDPNSPNLGTVQEMMNGLHQTTEAQPFQVIVNGITEELDERLDGIVKEYDTRINELSDRISDLNREKITVEIPDSLLGAAGISNVR